jgi:ABC-type transport system substrate-binding protein
MPNFSAKKKFSAFSRWPSKRQWGQFFRILGKKEKIFFSVLIVLFACSLVSICLNSYWKNTETVAAKGGVFTEGVVGQPRFINPIYSSTNDVDRDLVELIFSGLMKYDQDGNLTYDLAKNIQTEDDGKTYRIFLIDNAYWSDSDSNSKPIQVTADDVIFTIKTIQDSAYKSPLRANWISVDVEKINDFELTLKLENPYASFLENLTLKILPSHIWQNVSAQNFPLSIYNWKPVGSGPYVFENLAQNDTQYSYLTLKANKNYYGNKPYMSEMIFKFFASENDLVKSAEKGELSGFSLSSAENASLHESIYNAYSFTMPRYFAVFFNPDNSKALSDSKVRQALNSATNKQEILESVYGQNAEIVDSPILPNIYGFNLPKESYAFDMEKAKSLLSDAGYKESENGTMEKTTSKQPAFQFTANLQTGSSGTQVEELQKCLAKYPDIYPSGEVTGTFGTKTKEAVIAFQEKYADEILTPGGLTKGSGTVLSLTRKKLNELCFPVSEQTTVLSISLTTINQPNMVKTAELLKTQWAKIGVQVEIKTVDEVSFLESDVIKPRSYEAILFGEALGKNPDPFPFWHSTQVKDPGLNLAIYENEDADKLLEDARETLEDSQRQSKLEEFQDMVINDAPCVFLYSPDYIYFVSKDIQGIKEKMITDPSKRFTSVENWYIKTKRAWK